MPDLPSFLEEEIEWKKAKARGPAWISGQLTASRSEQISSEHASRMDHEIKGNKADCEELGKVDGSEGSSRQHG